MARFDGVHAFRNNSAESEPIWIKPGALWVYSRGLDLADFGRDLRSIARAKEPGKMLFLSYKQRMILPISRRPNFTKFQHNTSTGVLIKPQKFDFFQRPVTSVRHNSAMIIVQRKFITKLSLYGKSSFHFYRWNQFKVIPLACTVRTWDLPPPKKKKN